MDNAACFRGVITPDVRRSAAIFAVRNRREGALFKLPLLLDAACATQSARDRTAPEASVCALKLRDAKSRSQGKPRCTAEPSPKIRRGHSAYTTILKGSSEPLWRRQRQQVYRLRCCGQTGGYGVGDEPHGCMAPTQPNPQRSDQQCR
jgi:hypothetical protein